MSSRPISRRIPASSRSCACGAGQVSEGMSLNGTRVAGVLRLQGAQSEKPPRPGRATWWRWRAWKASRPARCCRAASAPRSSWRRCRAPSTASPSSAEKRNDDVKLSPAVGAADRGRPDALARAERRPAGDGAVGPGRHPSADRDRPAEASKYNLAAVARRPQSPYKETIKRGARSAFALQAADRAATASSPTSRSR